MAQVERQNPGGPRFCVAFCRSAYDFVKCNPALIGLSISARAGHRGADAAISSRGKDSQQAGGDRSSERRRISSG